MKRTFISLKVFDKYWNELGLNDDDLVELETTIMNNPSVGNLVQGTGGLRKMRYALPNRGKSGSVRVLYVDYISYETTFLLGVYTKSEQGTIKAQQKQAYKVLLTELLKELRK